MSKLIKTIWWENGCVRMVDQTLLPTEYRIISIEETLAMWEAIKVLRVRGAPAIGVAAAYGVCLALRNRTFENTQQLIETVDATADYLATSRPTAVNLFWALDRMKRIARENAALDPKALHERLITEAETIREEDDRTCRAIGEHGRPLIPAGGGVLTHCNAGGLATASYGTALAPMFAAHEAGIAFRVFADETRPLLQGARLTSWECHKRGIPVTLICDNMAAQVMREGRIQLAIVGADRIAANGDTANKIGTYTVAITARAHGIPFYVAAPLSTIDLKTSTGNEIPIEQRDPKEITAGFGAITAPDGIDVYNPAFDVTPAEYITGIVTEVGILRPPFAESIAQAFQKS